MDFDFGYSFGLPFAKSPFARLIPTFAGSQYGTLDTAITFTVDFEVEGKIATVSTAATFQTITADLTSFDNYVDYKPSTNQLRVKLGGGTGVSNTPSFSINDGKVHTVLVSIVSGVATVSIDGEAQASTITVGGSSVDFGLIGTATGIVNLFTGQILSTKFTDKSGAEDVITNYVFDSGSTTEQYARDGVSRCALTAFTSANWSRYTLQRNITHDAGTIAEGWVGDNVVVNGRFDTDTDWTKQAGITISGGELVFTSAGSGNGAIQDVGIEQNNTYLIKDTVTDYSSGALQVMLGAAVGGLGGTETTTKSSDGDYVFVLTVSTFSGSYMNINVSTTTTLNADNVSVQHLLEVV